MNSARQRLILRQQIAQVAVEPGNKNGERLSPRSEGTQTTIVAIEHILHFFGEFLIIDWYIVHVALAKRTIVFLWLRKFARHERSVYPH